MDNMDNMDNSDNPDLLKPVEKSNELKEWLVDYVGNIVEPENGEVNVEMIIKVVAEQFPEFLLAVAEENFIRGYQQAIFDFDEGEKLMEKDGLIQMRDYIIESSGEARKNSRERHIYGDKLVFLKDQLPYSFDLQYVLDTIEKLIPKILFENIDAIYVGSFRDLDSGDTPFNAKYKDGALYVTNDQENENDMVDDIVHEVAHAVEEQYNESIYSDNQLKREFLSKRNSLYVILQQEGYEPDPDKFNNTEYDKYFDYYLYNIVEYPTLESFIVGLFYSPYAATSINEYFATGFENYFLRDVNYLKSISPVLYNKINYIMESLENDN